MAYTATEDAMTSSDAQSIKYFALFSTDGEGRGSVLQPLRRLLLEGALRVALDRRCRRVPVSGCPPVRNCRRWHLLMQRRPGGRVCPANAAQKHRPARAARNAEGTICGLARRGEANRPDFRASILTGKPNERVPLPTARTSLA